MNRSIKTLCAVAGIAAIGVTMFTPKTSSAGAVVTGPATCVFTSSQNGVCSGTFLGVRNSPDPTDYVEFANFGGASANGGPAGMFNISISGKQHSCSITGGSLVDARGYFSVTISNGYCLDIQLINGSQYGDF